MVSECVLMWWVPIVLLCSGCLWIVSRILYPCYLCGHGAV